MVSFLMLTCGPAGAAEALPAAVAAALAQAQLPPEAVTLVVAPVRAGAAPPRLWHRADMAVNPASMAKLVTTFAALDRLGPAFTWRTPVYLDGRLVAGTLHGHVYLRGSGDPSLVVERLWLLLHRLQALGVRHITGDIVLDNSTFELEPDSDAAAFDGEPLRPYNAAPAALVVNYKSIVLSFTPVGQQVRVALLPPLAQTHWPAMVPGLAGSCGDWRSALKADFSQAGQIRFQGGYPLACGERSWEVADPEPATHAMRAVAGVWRDMGGRLDGQVREGRVPAGLAPVFEWQSPPLAEVVRDINKFSNNLMARQLFLTLAVQSGERGSRDAARAVVARWWRERVGGDVPVMVNGSGRAREERLTAQQLVRLLQTAWASPWMPEFVASLPAAGQDGTLRRASAGTAGAHLKTGSLRDVAGAAGYVDGASGQRYVVVAIANHPRAAGLRLALEALIAWAAADQ